MLCAEDPYLTKRIAQVVTASSPHDKIAGLISGQGAHKSNKQQAAFSFSLSNQ